MPRPVASLTPTAPVKTSHGSARSILLTLLGEYVFPGVGPVATSLLLQAFSRVAVGERSARQALNRSAASGWVEPIREGRRTSWRITAKGLALITRGSQRVKAVREPPDAWDGRWLVLYITLPESQRAQRLRLYRALSWTGFGNPTPGLWVCPHLDREADLQRILLDLGLDSHALAFVGHQTAIGLSTEEVVRRAWNLEAVAQHYQVLSKAASSIPAKPNDTLREHILLVNTLQRLPALDPGLPPVLLPANWPGHDAIQKLEHHRAALAPLAHQQWRQLLDSPAP